jgi:hypothetical protein
MKEQTNKLAPSLQPVLSDNMIKNSGSKIKPLSTD